MFESSRREPEHRRMENNERDQRQEMNKNFVSAHHPRLSSQENLTQNIHGGVRVLAGREGDRAKRHKNEAVLSEVSEPHNLIMDKITIDHEKKRQVCNTEQPCVAQRIFYFFDYPETLGEKKQY
jgi:hypothetical protein